MLEFQKQTITIDRPDGKPKVEAMVAVGTGLCYHHGLDRNKQPLQTYCVSHVASGYSICGHDTEYASQFSDEDAAKRFITLIQPLCDWNLSSDDLWKLDRSAMTVRLQEAHRQAKEVTV